MKIKMKKETSSSLSSSSPDSSSDSISIISTTQSSHSKSSKRSNGGSKEKTKHHCGDSSGGGISVKDRMKRIEEGVDLFHHHLTCGPTICLPATFRWAIAAETRACLTGCAGCASLNEGVECQRNGAAYSLMKNVQHTCSPTLPYCVTDRGSWEKVCNMIHFTVNHQARADAHWYQATIKSLGHTSLVSKKQFPNEEERSILIATLFCEILTTILLSHSIHTLYTALGQPVPPLPPFEDEEWDANDAMKPSYQHVIAQGILKKGKDGIRWPSDVGSDAADKKASPKKSSKKHQNGVSHVPIITSKDIDTKSTTWLSDDHYGPAVREYLMANMVDMHPLCVLSLAPKCMALVGMIIGGKFSLPETMGATPWKNLDKNHFCVSPSGGGGFTRANWELMQGVIAECYNTVFWQSFHQSTHLGLAGGKPPDSQHELLLILLCQTMAAKPYQSSLMEGVVNRMKEEQTPGTQIEAATALAYAEAYTKATDLAGLQAIPSPILYILTKAIPVLKYFSS